MLSVLKIVAPIAVFAVLAGHAMPKLAAGRAVAHPAVALPGAIPLAPVEPERPGLHQVALDAGRGGHFSATVEIAGRVVPMMVDTGASTVSLSDEDARELGIRPARADYRMRMNTANGVVAAASVMLASVRIGSIVVRDVEATVMPPHALSVSLLGMSFLRKLDGFEMSSHRLVLRQ